MDFGRFFHFFNIFQSHLLGLRRHLITLHYSGEKLMIKKCLLVVLLITILFCSGCTTIQKRIGSDNDKQLAALTATTEELRQALAKKDAALKDSEISAAQKQVEIDKLRKENAALAEQIKLPGAPAEKAKAVENPADIKPAVQIKETATEGQQIAKAEAEEKDAATPSDQVQPPADQAEKTKPAENPADMKPAVQTKEPASADQQTVKAGAKAKDTAAPSDQATPPADQAEKTRPTETKDKGALKSLRIKILAGTAQQAKAKVLSYKLNNAGYKIDRVDRSARSFNRSAVYYTNNFEEQAQTIAKQLGANTEIKKITWNSVFNIIITVGKKP